MASRFGGFLRRIVNNVNSAIRSVTRQPPPPRPRGPSQLPGEVFPAEPIAPSEPVAQEPFFAEPTPPVEPWPEWFGNEVTIYNDFFEPIDTNLLTGERLPPMTETDWFAEAVNNDQATLVAKYGIDHVDIIKELIREGYDYQYVGKDGKLHSGLFRDWREASEGTGIGGDSP